MVAPTMLHNGLYSRYPNSRELARDRNASIYDNDMGEVCMFCSDFHQSSRDGHHFFTVNNECVLCSEIDAADFYNMIHKKRLRAKDAFGKLWDILVQPIFGPDTLDVTATYRDANKSRRFTPKAVAMMKQALPVLYDQQIIDIAPFDQWPDIYETPSEALEGDAKYYVRPEKCKKCGGLGVLHSGTMKCYFCELERLKPSPRQAAKNAGEIWYTPTKPCKNCDQIAKRRVYDGYCSGCATASNNHSDRRQTPDSQIMRDSPDLILSRDDARVMGFKVYRTGEPCRSDHTGFRYVSTGNCIECLRK